MPPLTCHLLEPPARLVLHADASRRLRVPATRPLTHADHQSPPHSRGYLLTTPVSLSLAIATRYFPFTPGPRCLAAATCCCLQLAPSAHLSASATCPLSLANFRSLPVICRYIPPPPGDRRSAVTSSWTLVSPSDTLWRVSGGCRWVILGLRRLAVASSRHLVATAGSSGQAAGTGVRQEAAAGSGSRILCTTPINFEFCLNK